MSAIERQAARFLLTSKFQELYENEFEAFFHDLMCLRYDDFVDVRTAGNLGDMGSDGLSLHKGKLYACYAPQTYEARKLSDKFNSDLSKAVAKRTGQFDTFVFVHNDQRGMHPQVSENIATAAYEKPSIKFENFGFRKFRAELMRLDCSEVEDLLQTQMPVKEMTYGIGLDELCPLLDHLKENRIRSNPETPVEAPSSLKLDYNNFDDDTQDEIIRHLHHGVTIDRYYANLVDPNERDEVAAGFREEFMRTRMEYDDPEQIILRLIQYILGNQSRPPREHNAAMAVLTYFFQSCDIFDNAPEGWMPSNSSKAKK